MRVTHLDAKKPFECEQCGAGFGRKSSMMRHIESVHHRKRWYCGICEKSYSQKFDCDKHRRQEHGVDGDPSENQDRGGGGSGGSGGGLLSP